MERFLTLDCGAKTGWAWGDTEHLWKSGVWKAPKNARRSETLNAFRYFVRELVMVNSLGRIWFEQPVMPRARGVLNERGKVEVQQGTSFHTMMALCGYAVVIGIVSDDLGVEAIPIDSNTWRSEFGVPTRAPPHVKKHLKGADASRKWTKQQTLLKVRSLGHFPQTDDEGDAIGIFEAVRARMLKRVKQPGLPLWDEEVTV